MKKELYEKAYDTLNKEAYAEARKNIRQEVLDKELEALSKGIEDRLTNHWKARVEFALRMR